MCTKWDKRYLRLAREVSTWSKDPSTKLGAVAVGDERRVLETGYNGFPRGLSDAFEKYEEREEKYKYIVHAEMNAIYNASLSGTSLKGSTLYVYGLPVCSKCALGIAQSGISRVVFHQTKYDKRWDSEWLISLEIFSGCGITWDLIEDID